MGAYSPAPIIDDAMAERVMRDVMRPTVEGLHKDGEKYVGIVSDYSRVWSLCYCQRGLAEPNSLSWLSRAQRVMIATAVHNSTQTKS